MAKKERIEIQLDQKKDAKLIQFIDENGTTRAGFIKFVLRHYMNSLQGDNLITIKGEEEETNSNLKNKKVPKLGQSFSSKDFK